MPEKAVQIIESTDRMLVDSLIKMDEFVDVIIPRGGKSLIQKITDSATIPVIKHLDGNCHIYVDEFSDIETNGPKEQLFPIIEFFSINTGLLILKVLELFDSVKFEFNKNSKPDFSPVIVPISMNFLH